MTYLVLVTASIGVVVSIVLVLLSTFLPRWFVSDAVHQVDHFRFGNRLFSKRESQIFGLCIHLVFSLFFGALFGVLLNFGILDVGFVSMVIYGLVISLIFGGIVFPLEGHGLFGWKEDHWIPVDLLVMNAVWVLIFWGLLVVLV